MIKNSSNWSHEMNKVSPDLIVPVDHNLLDFIEARKPKFIFQTNDKEATREFERDLEGAVRRSYSSVQEFITNERNAFSLSRALDDGSHNDRPFAINIAIENILKLVSNDTKRLNFEPTTMSFENRLAPILPDNCSCAIGADGSTAYISSGLGLRELLIVTHTAVLQQLVISARTAGAKIDKTTAVQRLSQLLGSGSPCVLNQRIFNPIKVQKGASFIDGFFTASDGSSLAL